MPDMKIVERRVNYLSPSWGAYSICRAMDGLQWTPEQLEQLSRHAKRIAACFVAYQTAIFKNRNEQNGNWMEENFSFLFWHHTLTISPIFLESICNRPVWIDNAKQGPLQDSHVTQTKSMTSMRSMTRDRWDDAWFDEHNFLASENCSTSKNCSRIFLPILGCLGIVCDQSFHPFVQFWVFCGPSILSWS